MLLPSTIPTVSSELPYKLGEMVGQGRYGQVFVATHKATGEVVALKSLDCQRLSTRLFLQELDFLVRLRHPHIVSWLGVLGSENCRYVMMDYCDGGSLRTMMEQDTILPLDLSLRWIEEILLALDYIHEHDVVHCDIKPDNILLSGQPAIPQLADFGISKPIVKRFGDKGGTPSSTGSPAYMAPERYYGHYYPASDLYAIGVILFELVVGSRPFVGTPKQIQLAHLNQPVAIPQSVPFLIRSLILKAMQKMHQNRYQSAKEMLQVVQTARIVAELELTGNGCQSVNSPQQESLQIASE
ncbi:MAG: serine/threonine-protein kinase [Cyanobacteria bacterium P01_H01_bin.15]